MLTRTLTAAITFCSVAAGYAQFAPQAPLEGHTGIHRDDDRITAWASGVTFERGLLDIADGGSGYPTYGEASSAMGYPDGDILSLGDAGHAVVTFDHPVRNGDGPDFAVFENGFANPLDATQAYLEFAFVEVSSDGVHFVRFPATCNIQDTLQTDNFSYSDASLVNNLAGKYIANYGTPFDLAELEGTPGLDLDHITHIRVVDVVGSLDPAYGTKDQEGHLINDPYPSVYVSGGFDLDAVAVLHSNTTSLPAEALEHLQVQVFPNPATDVLHLSTGGSSTLLYTISDLSGRIIAQQQVKGHTTLPLSNYLPGMYLVTVTNGAAKEVHKIVKK